MTNRVEDTMQTVAGYLDECVGGVAVAASGDLWFPFGSTRVVVSGSMSHDQQSTFVHLRSHIADCVPVSDDLLRWLPTASNDLAFGHVTLEFETGLPPLATLQIRHTLLGEYLELDELRLALSLVAMEADRLDDLVVQRFGGKRYADHEVA